MNLSEKIKKLGEEYTDPDDANKLVEWQEIISKAQLKEKFYALTVSQDIKHYLISRIKGIKMKLATTEGMERVDNLAWHARKQENESLLAFFSSNPQQDIKDIENEIDSLL